MKRTFIFILCILIVLSLAIGSERTEKSAKILVVTNARLIDDTDSKPRDNMTIMINNGRFSDIAKAGQVRIPEEASVIDAEGKTVIPGLIDVHYHMCYPDNREPFVLNESACSFRAAFHLRRHLMGGITTVMDAGAYHNVGFMAKKVFEEGHLIGSRPFVVGERINATGGHGVSRFDMAYEADGPDEFRKAVRLQIKGGADVIKILPPYTKDELAAAIDEAHRLRKIVAVHSGYLRDEYDYIRWAVELDANVIEHAYALPDDVIETMGKKGIYAVPTMTIMMKLHARPGQQLDESKPHPYEIIFRKLKAAGVKMAIGTDAIYEFMQENPTLYFEEVERFVKNGYTAGEAIVAATRRGAEVIGAADSLGTIEKGKIADMLIIDGEPLKDIKNLRNVSVIIQNGEIIKR